MLLSRINVVAQPGDTMNAAWLPGDPERHRVDTTLVEIGDVVIWMGDLERVERLRDALSDALDTAARHKATAPPPSSDIAPVSSENAPGPTVEAERCLVGDAAAPGDVEVSRS